MSGRLPKISIVTAVYNGMHTLPAYFDGIEALTYPNLELILIDGASPDGSGVYSQRRAEHLTDCAIISEPDQGIYDAWNKGVALATGEWIAFLGCDDQYARPDALALLAAAGGTRPGVDFVSARARMYAASGRLIRERGATWTWFNFKWRLRDHIVHQGALHHRRLFNRAEPFDLNYKIAGDYEFLLRAGPTLNAVFVPETLLHCGYGVSSQAAYNGYREVLTIQRRSPFIRTPEALLAFVLGLTKYHAGRLRHRQRHVGAPDPVS